MKIESKVTWTRFKYISSQILSLQILSFCSNPPFKLKIFRKILNFLSDSRISGSKATVKLKIKVDSFFGFSLIIWILQTKNRLAVNRGFIETWHSPQWTAAVRQVPTVILQNLTEHPKSKYHKGSFKYFTSELKKTLSKKYLL